MKMNTVQIVYISTSIVKTFHVKLSEGEKKRAETLTDSRQNLRNNQRNLYS